MFNLTCITNNEVIYYTHIVPIALAFFLGIYLLIKTRRSLLSKMFLCFISSFCLWLILDLIAWMPINYDIISFAWSLFDYTNCIFFLLGLYFFAILVFEKDIEWQWQIFGFTLIFLPFIWIISTGGIQLFDQRICEALNNSILFDYKNYLELFVIIGIIWIGIKGILKKKERRGQIIIVAISLLVFFITFALTDYMSVQTEVYEIGLYGLFVLPFFLGLIVYAIVKHNAFNVDLLAAQTLVAALVLLNGSQFLFTQNNANRIITIITFFIATLFGISLIKGVRRDIEMQKKLQRANTRLKEIDDIKSRFLSIGTHKILSPVTVVKGYTSLMQEGNFGQISERMSKVLTIMDQSTNKIEKGIRECLDLSRLTYCEVKEEFSTIKIGNMIEDMVENYRIAFNKDVYLFLAYSHSLSNTYIVGDKSSLKRAFSIILENAIQHMQKGTIFVHTILHEDTVEINIVDTREKEIEPDDTSSILGMSLANEIIETHKGNLKTFYDDREKKMNFIISLPLTQKTTTQTVQ